VTINGYTLARGDRFARSGRQQRSQTIEQTRHETPSTPVSSLGLAKADVRKEHATAEAYGRLPLSFEANRGQADSQVKFLSRGPGYQLFLTSSEAVFDFARIRTTKSAARSAHAVDQAGDARASAILRMKMIGGNNEASMEGEEELAGKSNYFIGNDPQNWRANVPTYTKVRYRDVYPGIDLVYYGNQRQLEYDLMVSPGADPRAVTLAFDGTSRLAITKNGDLRIKTRGDDVLLRRPSSYQERDGGRQQISTSYVIKNGHEVGVRLADYDRSRPLVIDPVLVYSTYLGGSSYEFGAAIAVDSDGNAYVTGETNSNNFPTANAFQSTRLQSDARHTNVFVSKLNAAGSALVYSTYLGGRGVFAGEMGNGIAVDATGNAFVGGTTNSSDFPTTAGVVRGGGAGSGQDGFVTRLTSTGALSYSTYVSGGNATQVRGLAIDSSDNAYVVGGTDLTTSFPIMNGAQTTAGGGGATSSVGDAFLVKLNPTATQYLYSTFIGGSDSELATGIAVDNSGHSYVSGYTFSTNFPTKNPLQATFGGGGSDAFVAKYDTTLTGSASLIYATFLGGSSSEANEAGFAGVESHAYIAIDSAGNAYVTGPTRSSNFPTTSNAFQKTFGAVANLFVTKINPAGSALVYSTFIGGGGYDIPTSLAVDSSGNAFMTGISSSGDYPQTSQIGPYRSNNAIVTKLNANGSALIFSTFLGGTSANRSVGYGIAVDGAGSIYVTGDADNQTDFPTTSTAFQKTLGGDRDAFVTKIGAVPTQPFTILTVSPKKGGDTGTVSISIVGNGFSNGATASLKRLGQADIVADTVTISGGGTVMTARFNLLGKARGSWDVVITNPDNNAATLAGAFTIEAGTQPQAYVNVIGHSAIRIGSQTSFFINYGNSGDTDVYDVLIYLHVPRNVPFTIEGPVIPPVDPSTPSSLANKYAFDTGSDMLIPVYVYKLGAGSSGTITLKITPPASSTAGTNLSISAVLAQHPADDFSRTGDFAFPSSSLRLLAHVTTTAINNSQALTGSGGIRPESLRSLANENDAYNIYNSTLQTLLPSLTETTLGIFMGITASSICALLGGTGIAVIAVAAFGPLMTLIGLAGLYSVISTVAPTLVAARDPNDKAGAPGVGVPQYITGDQPLPYAVFFENVDTATAPAQVVTVTDQLDPNKVDLTTFSLGQIRFGSNVVSPPPGLTSYTTTVDLRPSKNLILKIESALDQTGLVTWKFTSLDPATGQLTSDPTAGFLPPNKTAPEGEGKVLFTVATKSGIATGTQITNKARVVFDVNSPIDTPQWLNTIDNTKPTSKVSALSATQSSVLFNVSWSGTDTGSGIRDFTVYVSENGGPFTVWQNGTTATSAMFAGKPSRTYAFYSIAHDQANNQESPKTVAEATTATRTDIPNAVDDAGFFVWQHYLDFLNRQADASGLSFWIGQTTNCGAADPLVCRVNVSAAFYLSIEFQNTGFYAIRVQRVAFGKKSKDPATRMTYQQVLGAAAQLGQGVVVLATGWEQVLEANKQAYAEQIVGGSDFISRYPLSLSATQYVDALITTASVTVTTAERNAALTAFGSGNTTGRAAALRAIAEAAQLTQAGTEKGSNSTVNREFREAFVLMQYYGYLRRNPTDAPDNNDNGYQFWLQKLNDFGGDYVGAEMVKAFISSTEYRQRFTQ
jgi:hypothetical protein